jgi:hypothetical protein
MAGMYEAATKNFREVEKALVQLERAINQSVRNNDRSSVQALTRAQLLLVSVKTEARFTKIIFMPDGLSADQRSRVLGQSNALARWKEAVDLSFRRHYKVRAGQAFARVLDHDVLAKHQTLHDLIDNELRFLILLRNKLAHGQWVTPFNTDLTAVEGDSLRLLQSETTLSLKYRDNMVSLLGHSVTDLVKSGPDFEGKFNGYFRKIRENRENLANHDFEAWCAGLRARKPRMTRTTS